MISHHLKTTNFQMFSTKLPLAFLIIFEAQFGPKNNAYLAASFKF